MLYWKNKTKMLFCFILVYTYKELYDIVEKTNKKTQCYT